MRASVFGIEASAEEATRLREASLAEDRAREAARKESREAVRASLARSHQETDRATKAVLAAACRSLGVAPLPIERDLSAYAAARQLAQTIKRISARQPVTPRKGDVA